MTNFPIIVETSLGKQIRLGKQLGKGGEGAVFEIQQHPDYALKLYWQNKAADRRSKVEAMVSAGWHKSSSFVAFPVDAVYTTSGTFLGFVMRKVDGHKPAHLLFSPASRKTEFTTVPVSFRFLVRAAINASKAVASVHSTGCIIGDVNHSGFLVSEKATITLIDSDSFQVASNAQNFLCKVGTPEYTPPELQGQRFDRTRRAANHDNFGLAVLIFQLLFMGRHPFSGRFSGKGDMPLERSIAEYRFAYSVDKQRTGMEPPPNVPLLSDFPSYIAEAFEHAFDRNGINKRPTAVDWINRLEKLEGELQPCTADPAHHHVRGKPCPWCRMERGTPGFIAFVSSQQNALPLNIDVGSLVAILRGISDPGEALAIETIVKRPPPSPSQQASLLISQINMTRALGFASSIGGVLFMQAGAMAIPFGLAMVGAGAFSAFYVPKRFQKHSEERRQALSVWNGIREAWKRQSGNQKFKEIRADIDASIQQLKGLPDEEKKGLAQLEHKKKERQLTQHLERYRIADHKIPKIGSGRKAVLASFGIETAADITQQRIAAIQGQGFGPALIGELMTWRASQERRFTYRPQEPLNPADIVTLKANIRKQYAECHAKARTGISSLQQAVHFIVEERRRLASAAQPSFERLCKAEVEERAGFGWGQQPAKYASLACVAVALITLFQPRTNAETPRATQVPVAQSTPVPSPSIPKPMQSEAEKSVRHIPITPKAASPRPQQRPENSVPNVHQERPSSAGRDEPAKPSGSSAANRGLGGPLVPVPAPSSPTQLANTNPQPHAEPLPLPNSSRPDTPIGVPRLDLAQKTDALKVQRRLIELKFLDGSPDGIWGPRSSKALSAFRASQGLGKDERWDEVTQNFLFDEEGARRLVLATFMGGWTTENSQCGRGLAPLRISYNHAQTDAGRCDFEDVQEISSWSWKIRARCSSDGSNWPANITLTRIGSQLTWKSERGIRLYYACSSN